MNGGAFGFLNAGPLVTHLDMANNYSGTHDTYYFILLKSDTVVDFGRIALTKKGKFQINCYQFYKHY